FFFSGRRRHTRFSRDWSSDVCSSDLKIRRIIPDCSISQDIITGFPTETEEDHKDTLSLMEYAQYDFGYMFAYSERPGTLAARKKIGRASCREGGAVRGEDVG